MAKDIKKYFHRCVECKMRAFEFVKNPNGQKISEKDIRYEVKGVEPFKCQHCGKEVPKEAFGGANLVAREGPTYTKYKAGTPVHWTWYLSGNKEYKGLVDTSLTFLEGCKGSVLDVGYGDGLIASHLLKMGLKVTGLEPEKDGIEAGEKMGLRVKVHNTTVENYIKGKMDKFDYMYSMNTIEHVDDATAYLKIMESIKNFAVVITDNAINKLGNRRSVKEHHTKEFSYEELADLFKDFKTEKLDIKNPSFIAIKIYAK